MKRAVSILCVVVMLMSMLALAGCGISGNYKLVSMSSNGVSMDASQLGVSITLTINGKTAIISGMSAMGSDQDSQTLTVDTKNKVFLDPDGSGVPYRVEKKQLILEKDGTSMVFEKIK